MNLGDLLRSARVRKRLTQEELGEKMNRSRTSITTIESNDQDISFMEAVKWGQLTNGQDVLSAAVLNSDPLNVEQVIELLSQHISKESVNIPEINYKCQVQIAENMVEVNVFSEMEMSKEEIRKQAILQAKEFAKDLGRVVSDEKIIPICYSKEWF